ncbi:MAG: FAD-dependent oxidoreductase [Alphaproteobacteria bacterium]|nr:FAD-dependent oxidoreductase [Rhodospirillaceae bacterium]MDG2480311.1 FAD-dependent oxidoreductase [Alphaproteobacteria bacterium]
MAPLEIGPVTLRNRIVSTGHDTGMSEHGGLIGDQLIAYQEARAKGGAGLIVLQVAAISDSAFYTSHILQAMDDSCIPGYQNIAEAVIGNGATCFGQIFHPGREMLGSADGTLGVSWSASTVANERYHVKPRAMSQDVIAKTIQDYADAADRLRRGGIQGVEIVASHGYLPAQFLSANLNKREDDYGGSPENRLRFLREVLQAVRERVGPDMVVGARISGDDKDGVGLELDECLMACQTLDDAGLVDYLSVVAGSSATRPGSFHIVPPMVQETGYTAPLGRAVKERVDCPVIVTGRINQPQIAEGIIERGDADACGMTRALIADPKMPNKTSQGQHDDIRACIACNQACAGHFFMGAAISCIQHPETGREREFGAPAPAAPRRKVLVAGGGPGGMKAAAVAASRGHEVILCEAGPQLGGQALLAQLLPSRAEFGGIVTNLVREIELAGVEVRLNTRVDRALVENEGPDAVVIATGAEPSEPEIEGADEGHVVNAWQVLRGEINVGQSVVVADWRCDWVGLGVAEKLALDGCQVQLAFNGAQLGESLMQYMRDHAAGRMFDLGVTLHSYARVFGVDADTVYLEHAMARKPIVCEGVDTLVTALGHEAVDDLEGELAGMGLDLHLVGDCLTPRTAEEAVLEGMKAGCAL